MEKRYILFMVLSMGLMVGYVALDLWLHPPKPVVNNGDQGKGPDGKGGKDADGKDPDGKDNKGPDGKDKVGKGPDGKGPDGKGPDGKGPDGKDKVGKDGGKNGGDPPEDLPEDPQIAAPPKPLAPSTWAVIGSYDGSVPGPFAVTIASRGGGIERWELVERNAKQRLSYRNLSSRYGYLGLTAWDNSSDGCTIRAISPGSPAAQDLLVGDEIRKIEGTQVERREDVDDLLAQHMPGDQVTLTISRGGKPLDVPVELAVRPLELIRPEKTSGGMFTGNPPSFLVSVQSIDGIPIDPANPLLSSFHQLKTENWTLEHAPDRVELTYLLDEAAMKAIGKQGRLEIVKRFYLQPPPPAAETEGDAAPLDYHLRFELEVRSLDGESYDVVLAVDGPNGVTDEGWWYQNKIHPRMFRTAGARDIVCFAPGYQRLFRSTSEIYSLVKKKPQSPVEPFFTIEDSEDKRQLRYLALDTQYFTVALLGDNPGDDTNRFLVGGAEPRLVGSPDLVERGRFKTANTTFRVETVTLTAAAGSPGTQSFTIFGGPKRPELLERYRLDTILEYGWFWYIAKPLAWILHFLYAVVRNYGLAIILLTVLVRSLMLPFGRKAARNAMMMQELAPEINKIKEKHKGDMQKQAEAQRELYKKYNFNPLSGCLPMLFQLPIFLGLYRCLSVDIELRQASFIPGVRWCSNLAGPDQLANWQSWMPSFLSNEIGWLGPYLNILPIATIALFLVQQKMFTPPAMDDQQRMSQKIMMYMMIFIGVMFFKVPSGLCIYFITSSLWGIAERKLIPKPELSVAGRPSAGPAPAASPAEPSKASLVARERARQRRKGRKS